MSYFCLKTMSRMASSFRYCFAPLLFLLLMVAGMSQVDSIWNGKGLSNQGSTSNSNDEGDADYETSTDNTMGLTSACSRSASEGDLIIFNYLYRKQSQNMQLYSNFCDTTFMQAYKRGSTSDMLVYASIFNPDIDTGLTSDISMLLNSLDWVYPNTTIYHYRVVVRFSHGFPPNTSTLKMTFKGVSYPIALNSSQTEYMIEPPGHPSFVWTPIAYSIPSLYFHPYSVQPYINESYVLVCIYPSQMSVLCDFHIRGHRVECYCEPDKAGYAVVSFILALPLVIVWVILLRWTYCSQDITAEPEVQFNVILCMPGRSTHEYLVIFRVGPATNGFDYDSSWVDILLFTGNQEPVGIPTRYSTAELPTRRCGEMHMVICRISPQAPITGILIHHGSRDNLLYFLDFTMVNLRDNCIIMQDETIDRWITDEPTVISVQPPAPQLDEPIPKCPPTSGKREKLLASLTEALSLNEKLAFVVLLLGLVATIVMILKTDPHIQYYRYWKSMATCMEQFLICVTSVSMVCWVLVGALEAFYLRFIKHPNVVEEFTQMDEEQCTSTCCFARLLFLTALHLLGLAFAGFAIVASIGIDHVQAFLWSGMYFSTVALTLGGWFWADDCLSAYQKREYAHQDYMRLMAGEAGGGGELGRDVSRMLSIPLRNGRQPSQTGLNQPAKSSEVEESYGPRLRNPNFSKNKTKISLVGSVPSEDDRQPSIGGDGVASIIFKQPRRPSAKTQPNVESYNQFMASARASSSNLLGGRGRSYSNPRLFRSRSRSPLRQESPDAKFTSSKQKRDSANIGKKKRASSSKGTLKHNAKK